MNQYGCGHVQAPICRQDQSTAEITAAPAAAATFAAAAAAAAAGFSTPQEQQHRCIQLVGKRLRLQYLYTYNMYGESRRKMNVQKNQASYTVCRKKCIQ